MRFRFSRPLAATALAAGMVAMGGRAEAQAPPSALNIKAGEADLSLKPPAELIYVDGLDPAADAFIRQALPPQLRLLAFYADPVAWRDFRQSLNKSQRSAAEPALEKPQPAEGSTETEGQAETDASESPAPAPVKASLSCFALAALPQDLAELDSEAEHFNLFQQRFLEQRPEARLIDSLPDRFSYELPLAGGSVMLGSVIRLKSRLILLNVYASADFGRRSELAALALSWRDSQSAETGVPDLAPPAADSETEQRSQSTDSGT